MGQTQSLYSTSGEWCLIYLDFIWFAFRSGTPSREPETKVNGISCRFKSCSWGLNYLKPTLEDKKGQELKKLLVPLVLLVFSSLTNDNFISVYSNYNSIFPKSKELECIVDNHRNQQTNKVFWG